jgi:hypothetical protein
VQFAICMILFLSGIVNLEAVRFYYVFWFLEVKICG